MAHTKKARENTLRDSVKIDVQNGQSEASMVRETSPDGVIVVHAIKKSKFVHERLFDLGRINSQSYDAAERFSHDFERAGLMGRYSSLDMNRSSCGGFHIISDSVVEARQRVNGAMASLGSGRIENSLSKSCVWFIVGCGDNLASWATRRRSAGDTMSEGKASGILISSLERLAMHYGLTSESDIRKTQARKSFSDGVAFSIKIASSFIPKKASSPRDAIVEFSEFLSKRIGF